MPWHVAKGHGCSGMKPWAVVGPNGKAGCHSTKRGASRQMRALYANVEHAAEKSLAAAADLSFPEARRLAARLMIPMFRVWYVIGWGAGSDLVERVQTKADDRMTLADILARYPDIATQINEIDSAADAYVASYFDRWWGDLTTNTQARLRSAVQAARDQGLQPGDVADLVTDVFGPARAKVIAATEVPRLVGGGMVASYDAAGINSWRRETVNDSRVCPLCVDDARLVHPISTQFASLHPRDRCFPRPIVPGYD